MKVECKIQGVTPLLMNRFTEANEVRVSSGRSPIVGGESGTPRDQATLKAYREEKGDLYIPGPNIFSCIIQAGKFHKVGKSKVTTQKSSLVPAGVCVLDIVCPLKTKNFEVDSRSVVIPSTGGRIMCHRPRLDNWELIFNLEIDTEIFKVDFVRQLVDDAGKRIGLGDYRPDRKGPFGKFVVASWRPEKK